MADQAVPPAIGQRITASISWQKKWEASQTQNLEKFVIELVETKLLMKTKYTWRI